MNEKQTRLRDPEGTRQRLVDAAITLMLRKGFSATSVDDICREAGLTKGGFFHHFEGKEDLAKAAVAVWGERGTALYATAWEDKAADPLDQLRRFFGIMEGFAQNPDGPCVCMVGMMSQEMAETCPEMRVACERELRRWTENTARLLTAAKKRHNPRARFDPESVAWFLNSVWQGSMLIAKTSDDSAMIVANLRLARAYVESLFVPPTPTPTSTKRKRP